MNPLLEIPENVSVKIQIDPANLVKPGIYVGLALIFLIVFAIVVAKAIG